MHPTLLTPRLALRPARPDDVDLLWRLWTAPAVRRYLWDDRTIEREEAAATLADCLALAPEGLGLWILERPGVAGSAPPDEIVTVGCAGLLPVTTAAEFEPRLAGLVEPLVALAPEAWGRGYAGEALAALLVHAESTCGLTRLAAVTDVPNAASDRMLRRAGFTVLGEVAGPRYRLRTYLWSAPGHAPADATQRGAA